MRDRAANQSSVPDLSEHHPAHGLDVVYSCSRITPEIIIGNFACSTDGDFVKALGAKSIISLAPSAHPTKEILTTLTAHSRANLEDGPGNDRDTFLRVVNDLAEMVKYSPPVLVCCHAGRSRSPAVVAAYLMLRHGYTPEMAFSIIQEQRELHVASDLYRLVASLEGTQLSRK
ncbi:MAG: dual specificity protein phosphatase family protein [Deltaproteobacteria bacterium]|nr:dual specificity protein phosphatase family protein [Deltaproteobacteria bacterium]